MRSSVPNSSYWLISPQKNKFCLVKMSEISILGNKTMCFYLFAVFFMVGVVKLSLFVLFEHSEHHSKLLISKLSKTGKKWLILLKQLFKQACPYKNGRFRYTGVGIFNALTLCQWLYRLLTIPADSGNRHFPQVGFGGGRASYSAGF